MSLPSAPLLSINHLWSPQNQPFIRPCQNETGHFNLTGFSSIDEDSPIMAHLRKRHLEEPFRKALKWAPTLSLIGMRQSGKTTLIKEISNSYFTLDDEWTLGEFERSNWIMIDKATPPVAIDECQKLPKLFDRVKLSVDQRKQMGRFILTGSVRFLSKKQIRESLTGRTAIFELLPFLISESKQRPLKLDILNCLKFDPERDSRAVAAWHRKLDSEKWLEAQELDRHLSYGGIPGISFRRDQRLRYQLFQVHLDTLLSRDVYYLVQTRLTPEKLRNLYRELSLVQGLPVSHSEIARKVGITPPTVNKMIEVFSALFLLRRHGKTLYCEDGGLAEYVVGGARLSERQRLKGFVYRELLGRALYHFGGNVELSEYRTRGGAEVPFIWASKNGDMIGFTVDAEKDPGEKSIRSLESFLKTYSKRNATIRAIALHRGTDRFVARKGILCLPITDLV
jgi:predicted AAA+ superfamily ATPase